MRCEGWNRNLHPTLWKTSRTPSRDPEGQVVLFRFPQTDQTRGKLRPALVIRKLPGPYDDWLICMISSQLSHEIPSFDEVVREEDPDFKDSGLKTSSIIRLGRLAVVEGKILIGAIGEIDSQRLIGIRSRLSNWIANKQPPGQTS